jgi:DNA-binding CsgD family transcriptional regulator
VDVTEAFDPPAPPRTVGTARQPPKDLSARERDVLLLLAQGNSNQQIADRIGVSVKTVETYRARLREKLGLSRRAELYRFAAESGLLDPNAVEPPGERS